MDYVNGFAKRKLQKAICFLQDGLRECKDMKSEERRALGVAFVACCEELDRIEALERRNKLKAIAWMSEEIDRLNRAPSVNQCDVLPAWLEATDNYMTAIQALKGEL